MSFISGPIASAVSNNNAQKATAAQNNATAQQQANFETVQAQEAPYRDLGTANIGDLQKMISGGYDMKASPSAQYAMTQGTKTINSNLGARGLEGNAVAQLGNLSSSTAAKDYQDRFSQLLAATNIGSNAVAMTGSGVNSLNANSQAGASNLGQISMNNGNQQASTIGAAAGNAQVVGGKLIGNYLSAPAADAAAATAGTTAADVAGGFSNMEYLGAL